MGQQERRGAAQSCANDPVRSRARKVEESPEWRRKARISASMESWRRYDRDSRREVARDLSRRFDVMA